MIPKVSDTLRQGFTLAVQPDKTFRMDGTSLRIAGWTDGAEALAQAILLILSTERYRWLIHSWDYGVELASLIGKDVEYCIPEIERRVREALLQDDRVRAVENFSFSQPAKRKILVSFTVETVYGKIDAEQEVEI